MTERTISNVSRLPVDCLDPILEGRRELFGHVGDHRAISVVPMPNPALKSKSLNEEKKKEIKTLSRQRYIKSGICRIRCTCAIEVALKTDSA